MTRHDHHRGLGVSPAFALAQLTGEWPPLDADPAEVELLVEEAKRRNSYRAASEGARDVVTLGDYMGAGGHDAVVRSMRQADVEDVVYHANGAVSVKELLDYSDGDVALATAAAAEIERRANHYRAKRAERLKTNRDEIEEE
jgi:hypothetical protein